MPSSGLSVNPQLFRLRPRFPEFLDDALTRHTNAPPRKQTDRQGPSSEACTTPGCAKRFDGHLVAAGGPVKIMAAGAGGVATLPQESCFQENSYQEKREGLGHGPAQDNCGYYNIPSVQPQERTELRAG